MVEDSVIESGTITLTMRSIEPHTKATQDGESAYNENLIESIHYFFYPKDGTDANTEKEPAKRGQVIKLNKQNEHTITISASENEIKNVLFKYPYNDCDVYVIVNLPSDINIDELPDRKLSTLKKIVLEANFEASLIQSSFVMEGLSVATVEDRNKVLAAKGVVPVDRVASKITISVNVDNQIDLLEEEDFTSGMRWTSNPDEMKIEFVNGVNRAVLSGDPSGVTLTKDDIFTDNSNQRKFTSTTIDGEEFWSGEPFYTYPTKWEIGSDEEPYLFITLPWTTEIWTDVGGQEPPVYKKYPCYYKVMLGSDELKRNTWYDLKINIGVLGSFENTPEVILPIEETDYFVADWSEGLNMNSEILGGRYLVLDKNEYHIYNQDSLKISFTSSHTCEIVDMSSSRNKNQGTITYSDYSEDSPDENAPYTWNSANWSLNIVNKEIVFKHKLRNDLSAGKGNYDTTPYKIRFRIRHDDEERDTYYQDVTITQYPAILIVCHPNRAVNNQGGVSVNNATNVLGSVHGLTGGNKNPNMYVIQTTVLPASSKNILGDPRKTSVDNMEWSSNQARGIENLNGNRRRLSNYYPTIETSDAANIIAPKFRIASSYGVTNTISYTDAKRRCASYQEDGYPAGRWRLPTQSEIAYIVQLSADGVIPTLFSVNNNYWCAGGKATPLNGGGVSIVQNTGGNNGPVRCVYDEWYWENSKYPRLSGNDVAFTWGDIERK